MPHHIHFIRRSISVTCCGKAFSRLSLIQSFDATGKICPICKGDLSNFDPLTTPKNVIIASLVEAFRDKDPMANLPGVRSNSYGRKF